MTNTTLHRRTRRRCLEGRLIDVEAKLVGVEHRLEVGLAEVRSSITHTIWMAAATLGALALGFGVWMRLVGA